MPLLDAITAQIAALEAERAEVARRSLEEAARIVGAVTVLKRAEAKLLADPELEQLFDAVAALRVLPTTTTTTALIGGALTTKGVRDASLRDVPPGV